MIFCWPRCCSGPNAAPRTGSDRPSLGVLAVFVTVGILLAACQSSRSAGSSQAAPHTTETAAVATASASGTTAAPDNGVQTPDALLVDPGPVAEATFEEQLAAIVPLGHRVALLLPLSGPDARVGKALLNAAQLALFDFADSGFELVVHDTEGTPDGAARAGRQAVLDGSSMIIGPLLATSVQQVAPVARAARINMVAFSNDRFVAGDGVFIMGFLPGTQVDRVVGYAVNRGLGRVAALAPENPYGLEVVDRLRRALANVGGELIRIEFYDPLDADVSAPVCRIANFASRQEQLAVQRRSLAAQGGELAQRALARLEGLQTAGALPYDALMIADGGKRLQAVAALLPYYDIDPAVIRMLGTGQWDEPTVGAEPALVGGWFAAPPPESRAGYETQYQKAYGELPIRLSTLAYDATALAAELARSPGGPDFSFGALTNPRGFSGRDGIFRFHTNGMIERGLAVIQAEPRGSRVIDPAPEAFLAP
jgi:branched-chain amino acid transport system substrate-binding protein